MLFLNHFFFQQVGMQGKGFEPTIDALFGKNGFFPDTVSKAMYWAVDNVPELNKWVNFPESETRKVNLVHNYNC